MKKPKLICLLLFVAVAVSCSRDPIGEPAPSPEQGHRHHAEAEWDEEFWQELQGDPVFQELREVITIQTFNRKVEMAISGIEDPEECRSIAREFLDEQSEAIKIYQDSLLKLYPEQYGPQYLRKALAEMSNAEVETRCGIDLGNIDVIGPSEEYYIYLFQGYMSDIYSNAFLCEDLGQIWDSQFFGGFVGDEDFWLRYIINNAAMDARIVYYIIDDIVWRRIMELARSPYPTLGIRSGLANEFYRRNLCFELLVNIIHGARIQIMIDEGFYHDCYWFITWTFCGCQYGPHPPPGSGWGGTNPPVEPPTYAERLQADVIKMTTAFGDKIKNIIQKTTVIVSDDIPNFAMGETSLDPPDIYDPNALVTIKIPSNLTDMQAKIILAHEFWHLSLIEISRNAGSYEQLLIDNPALAENIDIRGNNRGHHSYMVSEVSGYETIFRSACPGQSEEFYKYGKWGGGLMQETASFSSLSLEDQVKAIKWLKDNGLN